MPLKLLLDENLRANSIWQAVAKQQKTDRPLDIVRVGDAGCPPLATSDADVIRWAAANKRTIVSRDVRTLPRELELWLDLGHHHHGAIFPRLGLSARRIVEILATVSYLSDPEEWIDTVRWLP